jgi:hypothetical protein
MAPKKSDAAIGKLVDAQSKGLVGAKDKGAKTTTEPGSRSKVADRELDKRVSKEQISINF